MTDYHARARRNRGGWISALLRSQAVEDGSPALEDLQELVDNLQYGTHRLIALDSPAPARGYAIVLPSGEDSALVRLYVLPGTAEQAIRALFSAVLGHTRSMLGIHAPAIHFDQAMTEATRSALDAYGSQYFGELVQADTYNDVTEFLDSPEENPAPMSDAPVVQPAADTPEEVAEAISNGQTVVIGEPEPETQDETPAEEDVAELPKRSDSTVVWVDYAERHPLDPPIDLSPRTGLRDEIADAYLGS